MALWFLLPLAFAVYLQIKGQGHRVAWVARTYFHPLYWLVSRKDGQLELFVDTVATIMTRGGLPFRKPLIRRLVPWLRLLDVKACCFMADELIVVSHEAATAPDIVSFFVVGHEMGHYVDYWTKRKGHPLFDVIGHEPKERFASAVGWYCLEYLAVREAGREFDWDKFQKLLEEML